MRIREYQLDKIEEARRIQQECLRLHLPCPPVLHWGYNIKDRNGETVEIGRGKANSFTRNALNLLAYQIGMSAYALQSSSVFTDGWISFKYTTDSINATANRYISTGNVAYVYVGEGTDPESLDSYELPSTTLTAGTGNQISGWDETSRKIITTITKPYVNSTGASVNITESGVRLAVSSSANILMVRDVFSAITVQNGETITWTYTTEVAFPNP